MNLPLPDRYAPFVLLLLYLSVAACILVRIEVEATHYVSDDSHFYLRVADNLKAGKGLVAPDYQRPPFTEQVKESYFIQWPAGYPLLIAGVSLLTGTSSFWASKIVNLLFLGLLFLLLYKWYGALAWFPALYFCSYSMLEIYSYTWSEGPFLFFVLLLCYLIYKQHSYPYQTSTFILALSGCLASLFLLRYAGIFYFVFAAAFLVYYLYRKNYKKSLQYFTALGLALVVVLLYCWNNKQKTGYYTGLHSVYLEPKSLSFFIKMMVAALMNEITIIRNYYFKGDADYLYLALLLLEFGLIIYLFKKRETIKWPSLSRVNATSVLFLGGMVYLVLLCMLWINKPFGPIDYRFLSPFSAPMFIAILGALTRKENEVFFQQTYRWITAFFLLSLIMNLPKQYLLGLLFG